MQKFPDRNEIKKSITIIEYWMGLKGVEIAYTIGEKEIILLANPEESASLLKKSSFINDFCGASDDIAVEFMTTSDDSDLHGEHIQTERLNQIHWDQFVFHFSLTKSIALTIITAYEFEKALRNFYEDARKEKKEEYQLRTQHHSRN